MASDRLTDTSDVPGPCGAARGGGGRGFGVQTVYDALRRRGYFDASVVHAMIRDNQNGVQDHAYQIWSLLTFEIWARLFIDQPATAPLNRYDLCGHK